MTNPNLYYPVAPSKSMKPQTVQQATCESCDKSDENYTITTRKLVEGEGLAMALRCTCGQRAEALIPEDTEDASLKNDGNLSWEDASWNQEAEA